MNTNNAIYRIDTTSEEVVVSELNVPTDVTRIIAIGVLEGESEQVALIDAQGKVYQSFDAGLNWYSGLVESLPSDIDMIYTASFAQDNLSRVAVGVVKKGVLVHQPHQGWQQSTGFPADKTNMFKVVYSPANSQVVYAQGLEMDGSNNIRRVYRSDDAGLTFSVILTQNGNINLVNGNPLMPHPENSDVLYFSFGFPYDHRSYLYRYDHSTGSTTSNIFEGYDAIESLAFSPADSQFIYIPLSIISIN